MKSSLPNIRLRYLSALLLVAVLVTASIILVKNILSIQEGDASVINIDGKQRMLSQKIALNMHRLTKNGSDDSSEIDFRQALIDSTNLFERNHYELLAKVKLNAEAIFDSYFEGNNSLNEAVLRLIRDSRSISNSPHSQSSQILDAVFIEDVLVKLDSVVSRLEAEARDRVQFLLYVEMTLWFSTICLLLLEAILIFSPMEKLIRRSVLDLEDHIQRISALNHEKEEAEKLTAKIEDIANHDDLTGLLSLRKAEECLEEHLKLARQNHHQVALLFIDLDDFKKVNDDYGHDAGDYLLVEVATRIQSQIRDGDYACRAGGDEFLVIINQLEDGSKLEELCQRLLEGVCAPVNYGDTELNVGVSIGAAVFPFDAHDIKTLKQSADRMMYQVKKSGKSNYSVSNRVV